MAHTYDADQASYTNLNYLRLALGDTDDSYPLFTDAELNAVLLKCSNDFDCCLGILFEVLSVDPVRVMESRKATSGGVGLIDEMDQYAKRSEVYSD